MASISELNENLEESTPFEYKDKINLSEDLPALAHIDLRNAVQSHVF